MRKSTDPSTAPHEILPPRAFKRLPKQIIFSAPSPYCTTARDRETAGQRHEQMWCREAARSRARSRARRRQIDCCVPGRRQGDASHMPVGATTKGRRRNGRHAVGERPVSGRLREQYAPTFHEFAKGGVQQLQRRSARRRSRKMSGGGRRTIDPGRGVGGHRL